MLSGSEVWEMFVRDSRVCMSIEGKSGTAGEKYYMPTQIAKQGPSRAVPSSPVSVSIRLGSEFSFKWSRRNIFNTRGDSHNVWQGRCTNRTNGFEVMKKEICRL